MSDTLSTASITDPARISASQRNEEIEFVAECVRKSDAARAPYIQTWREVLENYMVAPHDTEGAFPRIGSPQITTAGSLLSRRRRTSRLKDPETHQNIESLAAQGMGLLLGSKDFIAADPVGADDPDKARYLSRILMALFNQPGVFRTFYQVFKDSFIFGTSVVEIGWEAMSRSQMVKAPIIVDGVPVGEDLVPGEVMHRNRPLIRQLDIFDCYWDPSGTRIQEDMLYFGKRFRIPAWKAQQYAEAGIFDRQGVGRAVDHVSGGSREENDGYGNYRRFQGDRTPPNKYAMLSGFEFYANVPYKPSDGYRNRVLTVLEGEWIRSHINPYQDGDFPFKEVVMNPMTGRFPGLGPAEVIRYLQDDADNMLMVYNETANLAARNVLLVGTTFGGDKNRLRRRGPNDVISCNDPSSVVPLPVDTNTLQFAAGEYQRKQQRMREATGAINPIQEFQTERQTATAFSGLIRLASQKVELMVQLIEKDDMPWIGRTLHSRMLQFLDPDAEIVLAGEPSPFTVADIDIEADVRFVGSRQQVSKFQKVAQLDKALTVLGQNPMLAMLYPQLVTRMLEELEIPDAEAVVKQAQQAAMMMQQMEAAQGAKPGSSKPGGSPPNLGAMTEAGQGEQQGEMLQ